MEEQSLAAEGLLRVSLEDLVHLGKLRENQRPVADGSADVAQDVVGCLDKFANINSIQKARADIETGDDGINNGPDFKVNVASDVLFALDAFQGLVYPFAPGDPCGPG